MGKNSIFAVVVSMVFLAVTGQALAERSYTYELTVGMDANDPNYDPNSNYDTINAAIVAMNAKSPPLSSTVLGCIKIYPGTYVEHLSDYYEPNGHDLPAHCDLRGMGDDINDVVIQHERLGIGGVGEEIYACGVRTDGDNLIENLMVENTSHANNQNSVEFGGTSGEDNGPCELKDCIVKSYHQAVRCYADSLVVSGCEITGYYLPCIDLKWSDQTFDVSNSTIIPKTRSWGGELPTGISVPCPGSIDNVTIQTSISSSDYIDHYQTWLGGIYVFLWNPEDLVTITNSTIDLTLTTIYNDRTPPETETWELFGIRMANSGEIVVEDCNIILAGIEDTNDTGDPNDDGQGIKISAILSKGTGKITVREGGHISTSRTTASNAEDGYEYLLNNESGTRTLCIDFNSITFDPNGPNEPNGYDPNYTYGDMNAPDRARNITQDVNYMTIQNAIDDANDGDIIEVFQGWHFETIDFNGVSCILRSTDPNDWDVVAATIIDAEGNGDGVTFNSNEDVNSILCGLTITGATGSDDCGMYCGSSSPIIEKCIIRDNYYGIQCSNSIAVIRNNKIYDNTYEGIRCRDSAMPTIVNNWIVENQKGINLLHWGTAPLIRNNTIADNNSYGIGKGPGGPDPNIINCIVWGHDGDDLNWYFVSKTSYCCIEDANDANGVGDITSDPCFVDDVNNDYRIYSTSGCIDAGDPNGSYPSETDIEGEDRVLDGDCDGNSIVNIGADETYYPELWLCDTQCHGDADCDGYVGLLDYYIYLDALNTDYPDDWNNGAGPYDPNADFDRGGSVDAMDYLILYDYWTEYPPADCNDGLWPPK